MREFRRSRSRLGLLSLWSLLQGNARCEHLDTPDTLGPRRSAESPTSSLLVIPDLSSAILVELQAEMARQRLTRKDFASRLGITQSTLAHRLEDPHLTTVADLVTMAESLGRDVADLVDEAGFTLQQRLEATPVGVAST